MLHMDALIIRAALTGDTPTALIYRTACGRITKMAFKA